MPGIAVTVGETIVEGELAESRLASEIAGLLPLESAVSRWGDELYFEIPLKYALEKPTTCLKAGDIAYWSPRRCLCLFYGPTPMSAGQDPVPASEVEVVGRMDGGWEKLKSEKENYIKIRLK